MNPSGPVMKSRCAADLGDPFPHGTGCPFLPRVGRSWLVAVTSNRPLPVNSTSVGLLPKGTATVQRVASPGMRDGVRRSLGGDAVDDELDGRPGIAKSGGKHCRGHGKQPTREGGNRWDTRIGESSSDGSGWPRSEVSEPCRAVIRASPMSVRMSYEHNR